MLNLFIPNWKHKNYLLIYGSYEEPPGEMNFKIGIKLDYAWEWSWWRMKNICHKNFQERYFYQKQHQILRRGLAKVMSL